MSTKKLQYKEFINAIDNLYDEINIWDDNYNLIYINNVCERHYGFSKDEMIGKNYHEFIRDDYWTPKLLPQAYALKKPVVGTQKTHMGNTITSIVIPILDENGNVKMAVSSVREEINDIYVNNLTNAETYQCGDNIEKGDIIYKSKSMENVINLCNKLIEVQAPVIILGESGVGKSFLARYMHRMSDRKDQPFITVNCGAIPRELMESELFGYEEGAFTGAKKAGKAGLFLTASEGTLLLDDISELSYEVQSKLLQVVQEKEFLPVGGTKAVKTNAKLIVTTNRDLKKLVEIGQFREDLYYRLSVFEIKIPPLRERPEDIGFLSNYFMNKMVKNYGIEHRLSKETKEIFKNYAWKGNIRELSHIIERLVVTTEDFEITPKHLPNTMFEMNADYNVDESKTFDSLVNAYKKQVILNAYNQFKTSRKVANHLGISQSKAARLIKEFTNED